MLLLGVRATYVCFNRNQGLDKDVPSFYFLSGSAPNLLAQRGCHKSKRKNQLCQLDPPPILGSPHTWQYHWELFQQSPPSIHWFMIWCCGVRKKWWSEVERNISAEIQVNRKARNRYCRSLYMPLHERQKVLQGLEQPCDAESTTVASKWSDMEDRSWCCSMSRKGTGTDPAGFAITRRSLWQNVSWRTPSSDTTGTALMWCCASSFTASIVCMPGVAWTNKDASFTAHTSQAVLAIIRGIRCRLEYRNLATLSSVKYLVRTHDNCRRETLRLLNM